MLHTGEGRQPVAAPLQRRLGGSLDQDCGGPPNLEIIAEGAELQVAEKRSRSATLPSGVTLTYSLFESEEQTGKKDQAKADEQPETKEQQKKRERRVTVEEQLYDQQQLGDHKFYSFTRWISNFIKTAVTMPHLRLKRAF